MYKYYKEIILEEHMLYPTEIAQIAGLTSVSGKPASLLVSAILQDYIKTLDNYEQYYYIVGNRRNKVYPIEVYTPAILNFLQSIVEEYGDILPNKIKRTVNNKVYTFKINTAEELN